MSLENVSVGYHAAVVDRVEFFKSSRKGTPGLKVFFSIPEERAQGICDIWLSEKAIGMARSQLRKLGYDPDKGTLRQLANEPTLLRGNEFEVEVYEDEYNNQFRKKAQIPTPRNDGLKADEIDLLDAAVKAGAKEGAPAPTESDLPPRSKSMPWDSQADDDIPF